jgi:transposase
VTAAVLVVDVGDPAKFASARSFLKACGLNLKEKSSGTKLSPLRLTKRGPPRARQYLWLASLRLLHTDDVARAWYAKKVARDGGVMKKKAVVALMRKLAKALFAVARGEEFDTTKLFDVTRLKLSSGRLPLTDLGGPMA